MPDLTPDTASAVLKRVFDLLVAQEHQGLVIGGVAVGAMGVERFTVDIDATVTVDNDSLESFISAAADAGFASRVGDYVDFAHRSRMILLVDVASGTGVDLSMAATPFETEAISRGRPVSFDGQEIPVATPEDLIVWKMIASRERDLEDVRNLVEMNPDLDLARVRHWLREFDDALDNPGLPEQFERLRDAVLARDP